MCPPTPRCRRGSSVAPIGNELVEGARLEDVAREDVRADLGALLDDAHAEILALLHRELLQPDRGRETGWPGADRDDIIFHRFARLIAQGPR